jgi:hypothetical protein
MASTRNTPGKKRTVVDLTMQGIHSGYCDMDQEEQNPLHSSQFDYCQCDFQSSTVVILTTQILLPKQRGIFEGRQAQ